MASTSVLGSYPSNRYSCILCVADWSNHSHHKLRIVNKNCFRFSIENFLCLLMRHRLLCSATRIECCHGADNRLPVSWKASSECGIRDLWLYKHGAGDNFSLRLQVGPLHGNITEVPVHCSGYFRVTMFTIVGSHLMLSTVIR